MKDCLLSFMNHKSINIFMSDLSFLQAKYKGDYTNEFMVDQIL